MVLITTNRLLKRNNKNVIESAWLLLKKYLGTVAVPLLVL